MTQSPLPVRHAIVDGIATLTLARPQARNAMTMAFMDAFHAAASAVADDPLTRVILIEAEGPHFCVGGDVRDFAAEDDPGAYMAALAGRLHDTVGLLARLPVPVVVAVQGVAAGAGLSLVAGADIAIAGRSSTFLAAYGALGLTADGGATWFLPRVLGLRLTQEMMYTGRRLTAEEAVRHGLVTRIVKDHRVSSEARRVASQIAQGPTTAYGMVKRLLAEHGATSLEQQLEAERAAIAAARTTTDGREGVAAFIGRRRPSFIGR